MSTKLLYAIAGNESWEIECIDVTSAFLQGSEIDRQIYVKPPEEANMEGYLWLMKKAAYGLYDASRRWWMKVMQVMTKLGGKTLIGDESLIYFHKNNKLIGLISLHVDDFQGAGNSDFFEDIMDEIANEFKISKREKGKFRFIGVDVERKADGSINISQETYKESLATIEVKNSEDNTRGLTKEEFKMYRGAIGKLTWLSEMSRPDLSFDTLDLAGYNNNATIQQLKRINKVVEKAKNEEGSVLFRRIGDFRDLKVLAISDGGLNRREDRTQSIM